MADYIGTANMIDLQKALQNRRALFARTPVLANGGRIMNILDPDVFGWENVRNYALQDGFVSLTLVDKDQALARLEALFDGDAAFPFWQAFTGQRDQVVAACKPILQGFAMPKDWRIVHETHPADEVIVASQALNAKAGVAPYPAYYLRGHDCPSLLSCLFDDQGDMVACASANMRYHPDSDLAGWLFAGGVSVAGAQRGRGLGSFINAALLCECQAAFNWAGVLVQVKADNSASLAMTRRCGLEEDRHVTIVVATGGGNFSR